MGVDWWILGFCGVVWLAHLVAVARFRRRSFSSYAIAVAGVGATVLAFVFARSYAPMVGAASVVLLLFAPAMLLRRSSVALRFGKPAKAQLLARIAAALRPVAEMRRMPRLYQVAERIARGEALDVDAAVGDLGPRNPIERGVLELALLSWTTRYETFVMRMREPGLGTVAVSSALAGPATIAVGEASDEGALLRHYQRVKRSRVMARGSFDGTLALFAAASYLGAVEAVEEAVTWLKHELPASRIAFARATAHQRAGRPEVAAAIVDRALEDDIPYATYRAMLRYRRRVVLPPAPNDEDFRGARADVSVQLRARRVVSALGFDRRAPAPLTRTLALLILVAFAYQLTQSIDEVFYDWAIIRPWSEAPEPVRLLSYAFLHVDGWHLSVNLAGLLLFGRFAEHQLGRFWTALAFVVGAVAGGAAFLWFGSGDVGIAVGASGAVLALFGVAMARMALDPVVRRVRAGRLEIAFLAILAAFQLTVDAFWALSAGSAHAGGLVAGLVIGALGTWLDRKARMPASARATEQT